MSNKKMGVLILVISVILLSSGIGNITGNIVVEYFQGTFLFAHILGLVLFFVSILILAKKEGLEAVVVPTGPSYEADRQRAKGGVRKYQEDKSRLVVISGIE